MTASDNSRSLAACAAKAADERQAGNIVALDVSDVMAIADVFLLASADTERQVRSIAEEVEDALSQRGVEPLRREGNREYRWVLLDYGGLVVHVQRNEEREFYGLDRLYRDCPALEIEGIDAPDRPGEWAEEVDLRSVTSIDEIPLAGDGPDDDLR